MTDQFQRTYPDHGVTNSQFIPADIDMAELAARVNSIDTYRREGRVLTTTDFSPSMGGWTTPQPQTVFITPNNSYIGFSSLGFVGDINNCLARKIVPITANSKIGFSGYFLHTNPNQSMQIMIAYTTPLTTLTATLGLNFSTGEIFYLDNAFVWQIFNIDPNITNTGQWINLKLVADFINGIYSRFFVNQINILDTSPLIPNGAPGPAYRCEITVSANPFLGNTTGLYFDGPIVSMHEF